MTLKKRHSWVIGFSPATSQSRSTVAVTSDGPRFYAIKMFATAGYQIVEFTKNGEPVRSAVGAQEPLDKKGFQRWILPGFANPDFRTISVWPLRNNGVQLVVDRGDRLVVRARWRPGFVKRQPFRVTVMGFVEVP